MPGVLFVFVGLITKGDETMGKLQIKNGWVEPESHSDGNGPRGCGGKTLDERINTVRRYGVIVSHDGFFATPTGPEHIDGSKLGRALLAHDELLAACKQVAAECRATFIDTDEMSPEWIAILQAVDAAIARAYGRAVETVRCFLCSQPAVQPVKVNDTTWCSHCCETVDQQLRDCQP